MRGERPRQSAPHSPHDFNLEFRVHRYVTLAEDHLNPLFFLQAAGRKVFYVLVKEDPNDLVGYVQLMGEV